MENPSPEVHTDEPQPTPASTDVPTNPIKTATQPPKRVSAAKLFDPQTRLGRFMRSLTRTLAVIVGLFALGVLASYLLLYKPLADEDAGLRADLAQARQQVDQLQQDVNRAEQSVSSLTKSNQDLTTSLTQAKGRQALLTALAAVSQARFDLASNKPADAKQALGDVSTMLDQIATAAGSANAAQMADMRSRLALVLGEMDRDPQTAASDLGILSVQLTDLRKRLGS